MPYSDYPHGSIAARGEEIYYHQLRKKVESKHKGEFLTIDIETGAYEIDADEVASSMRLLEKHPGGCHLLFANWIFGSPSNRL